LCAYDRLGLGRSDDPAPDARRTTQDLVDDVIALLDAADLQEPVVVAAHSMGSLPAIGLVDRAPERVAGVVLVDPLSPRVSAVQRELLPPKNPDEQEVIAEERRYLYGFLSDPAQNSERLLLGKSEDEVAEILDEPDQVFGDLPVVVLQAPYPPPPAGLPHGYAAATVAARNDGNQEFVTESTQGTLIEVENSGHHIQDDQPEVVMDAIREVIAG
jgi:pimeloyl-ACP methyl ester carboxylesterase